MNNQQCREHWLRKIALRTPTDIIMEMADHINAMENGIKALEVNDG